MAQFSQNFELTSRYFFVNERVIYITEDGFFKVSFSSDINAETFCTWRCLAVTFINKGCDIVALITVASCFH